MNNARSIDELCGEGGGYRASEELPCGRHGSLGQPGRRRGECDAVEDGELDMLGVRQDSLECPGPVPHRACARTCSCDRRVQRVTARTAFLVCFRPPPRLPPPAPISFSCPLSFLFYANRARHGVHRSKIHNGATQRPLWQRAFQPSRSFNSEETCTWPWTYVPSGTCDTGTISNASALESETVAYALPECQPSVTECD